MMRRASAVLLAIVLGLVIGMAETARADQNDPRLEALFRELRVVTGYLRARTLEQQIWEIWTASSNPEINRLMDDGVTAMATQDYKTALADFTKVVAAAPDFAEGWNKRATVLYLVGDYEGSLADVDKTLALEPRHFGALSGLGLIKAAQERDQEAIDAFEKALAVNPHMPGVIANIEHLKQRLKDKQI
jgi:tetratricopeptide (TPR) repeat protein